jgi:hypothetical protein
MTDLRKRMLEELECRNYAPSTARADVRAVDEYARYFNRPPDQLGPDHIRQYRAYLFRETKLQPKHSVRIPRIVASATATLQTSGNQRNPRRLVATKVLCIRPPFPPRGISDLANAAANVRSP